MEMVEVDVKLFIKCRLCLEKDGVYQIVPSINELIKDCFDIDTDPFDGLPQLICKNCKSILSDYHAVKTTYKLNQLKLRERLVNKLPNSPQSESETSPIPSVPAVAPVESLKSVASIASVAHAEPVEPVASAELGVPVESDVQPTLEDDHKENDQIWKRTYDKHYFCKICSKSYQKYSSIKRHVNTHKKILKKHRKVFRKYCTVQLNKVDNKENSTGSLNAVVYNTDKVITSNGNSRYHLLYLKKGWREKRASSENGRADYKRPRVSIDTSEEEIIKAKKRKTRRLCSGSSTNTTILEDATNNATNPAAQDNTPVVNINSVKDNETSHLNKNKANTTEVSKPSETKATNGNYKDIQDIVTMCQKKYIKKAQSTIDTKPPVSESSLKHKVLSLGRKVIHKQGFECTGLLRYVEHKDLDISWQPATPSNKKRTHHFVRIMTKLKSRKDLENDDSHWKDLHEITFNNDHADDSDDNNIDNIDKITIETQRNEKSRLQPELKNGEDQTALTNNIDDLNSKNKLLNKTPVANPKQLPKKATPEIKPALASDAGMPIIELDLTENAEVSDSQLCMPIITSTMSLSTTEEKKQTDPVIEKPAPRIKVKHPSELMSQRALNNQSKSEDLTQILGPFKERHANLPSHLNNVAVYSTAPMSRSQTEHEHNEVTFIGSNPIDKQNFTDDTNLEYVTLHCLELPNERTKYPFQYFKRVLQFHSFELLDINEELPNHFTALVTFKLLLKQQTIRPLGVWLSLFCSKNSFCFAFKDTNLRKFDPNQLPAFWQWELLKIYKGDVVTKILQNALKVSKEVHSYTNNFLCLLKSIKCVSEP